VASLTARQRRALVLVLVVAAALRLLWALYATKAPILVVSGDPFFYFTYAKRIAAGDGYLNYFTGDATAYYPVGYPAALAGVFWLVLHTPIPDNLPMAGSILNVVLGTATVWLVFAIGRAVFGTATGLAGAAITAVFPNLVFYTATMQVETTFIFCFLGAVAIIATHLWRDGLPSPARLVAFGGALGVSALVRPFSLPLLVALGLAVVVAGAGWRRALAATGLTTAAFVLVATPWIVRNAVALDAPVFSTNMGDTLCIDRYPGSSGRFRFVDTAGCAPPGLSEAARNTENTKRALSFVRHHPFTELHLVTKRAWYMLENDHDGLVAVEGGKADPFLGHRVRTLLSWGADAFWFAVLALAVFGVAAYVRGRRPAAAFTGFALVTLLAVPLVLWGSTRFHLPAEPLLALTAGATVVRMRVWRLARTGAADGTREASGRLDAHAPAAIS